MTQRFCVTHGEFENLPDIHDFTTQTPFYVILRREFPQMVKGERKVKNEVIFAYLQPSK